jgi:hypothetical protein
MNLLPSLAVVSAEPLIFSGGDDGFSSIIKANSGYLPRAWRYWPAIWSNSRTGFDSRFEDFSRLESGLDLYKLFTKLLNIAPVLTSTSFDNLKVPLALVPLGPGWLVEVAIDVVQQDASKLYAVFVWPDFNL